MYDLGRIILILVTAFLTFSPFCNGDAAVFNISNITDLQAALTTAQSNGQDDTINLAPGSYTVTSTLNYFPTSLENFSLTIQGTGPGPTILDGGNGTPILHVDQGLISNGTNANITIRGLTFQNGNESSQGGGALYLGGYKAQTRVEDSIFQNNTANSAGGALYLWPSSGSVTTIAATTFSENTVTGEYSTGGALYALAGSGTLTLTGNTFSNNSSAYQGGGIHAFTNSGAIAMTGNTFNSNVAPGGGGGAIVTNQGTGSITVSGNTFNDNSAESAGGAWFNGGNGPLTIVRNVFRNNIASTSSQSNGGGLIASSAGSLKIMNNLFIGNTASQMGAGANIMLLDNEGNITNNTFTGNTSTGTYYQYGSLGGGMYLSTYANTAIANIDNNIFWANTAAAPENNGADLYIYADGWGDGVGSFINLFNNDYSNIAIWYGNHLSQGGNINEDPRFEPDYKLKADSPCINTGSNSAPELPITDFEGNPRIIGGVVDIGAYEYFVSGPYADLSVSLQDQPDPVVINQELAYIISLANQGTASASAVTLSDTLPPTVAYISATPTQGNCSPTGNVVTCNIGTMESNQTVTITIVVHAPGTGGSIHNTAAASTSSYDPFLANDTAAADTRIILEPENVSLAKTGQKVCYDQSGEVIACSGTGQDGDTRVGVAWPADRFHDNSDGTITDNLTGLMWLKDANCMATKYPGFDRDSGWDDGGVYWQHALDFVAGMNGGAYSNCGAGHQDWHLPNINEFQSLVNNGYYEENCGTFPCWGNASWLISKGFLNVAPRFWTSNTFSYNSDYAWLFDLDGNYLTQDSKNDPTRFTFPVWPVRVADKTAPARVWKTGATTSYYSGDDGAVQAGVPWPPLRFTNNNDGTVTDNLTRLTWLRDTNCIKTQYLGFDSDDPLTDGRVTWQHALDFVKGMNNGTYPNCNAGSTNWRLPNIKELHSLTDYSGASPAFPPGSNVFLNLGDAFWSSTSFTYQYTLQTTAAYVLTTEGYITFYDKQTTPLRVWPVRSNVGSDLSISKQDNPDPVAIGNPLTYAVTITNHGPETATAVGLTNSLPLGVTYVSANSSQGSCNFASGTVTCSLGEMAADAVVTVTIVVNAPNAPGTILNTATVSCTSEDPSLANNTATVKTWVGGAVTLTITKDGNGSGTVTGPGINCGADCTEGFTGETGITLAAAADANSFFAGWVGGGCLGAGVCNTTIDKNETIRAVFNRKTGPVDLPQTGQTTTYAPRDDGAIRPGTVWPNPRFTILYCDASGPCANQASDCDSNPSTDAIIDNLTGLMWARDGDIGNMAAYGGTTWDGGITYIVDYINGRVFGNGICGHKDWKAPNANEQLSLLDSGPPGPSYSTRSWLTSQGFVKLQGLYWSSTSLAGDPTNYGWDVNIGGAGGIYFYPKGRQDNHFFLPVRNAPVHPVVQVPRTGQTTSYITYDPVYSKDDGALQAGVAWPDPRFTNPNGSSPVSGNVVLDQLTGLMWTKNANLPNSLPTWQGALDYIANMNSGAGYGGYKDWRLPNWIELRSLWDFSQDPMLPSGHPFINLNSLYWSSTTSPENSGEVLVAGFVGVVRTIGYDPKTYSLWVWPVRGGTIPPPPSNDLSITQSASPDPLLGGTNLTYTINVTNNGPDAASGVIMQDTLPAGTTLVSVNPTAPTCSNTGAIVSCNLGSIANGATVTVTIVVTVPDAAGWIRNAATVSSSTSDPTSGNNTAIRDARVYTAADPDSDGVSITQESGPAGTNPNYDGNNDFLADSQQSSVTSMHTFDGSNYITLASPNGTSLSNVQAGGNPSPGNSPAGVEFPFGFFGFTITGLTPGGATTLTLYLPEGAAPNTYYKYGPTPGNTDPHWYEFLYDGQTGAVIAGNVITLYFVDGIRGDDDLTGNGIIIDEGGPGLKQVDYKLFLPLIKK